MINTLQKGSDYLIHKTASFTGHRPDKLGGYNMKNPIMLQVKELLLIEIEDLILNHGISNFISGGALGLDQAAFWCVHILKKKYPYIKNTLAIPYANFGERKWDEVQKRHTGWSADQVMWYKKIVEKADQVVIVDTLEHYQKDQMTSTGNYSAYKLQIRNEYLVDNCSILVAIWDGEKKRGTWNCLRYGIPKDHLNTIIHYNPTNNFKREYLKNTTTLF